MVFIGCAPAVGWRRPVSARRGRTRRRPNRRIGNVARLRAAYATRRRMARTHDGVIAGRGYTVLHSASGRLDTSPSELGRRSCSCDLVESVAVTCQSNALRHVRKTDSCSDSVNSSGTGWTGPRKKNTRLRRHPEKAHFPGFQGRNDYPPSFFYLLQMFALCLTVRQSEGQRAFPAGHCCGRAPVYTVSASSTRGASYELTAEVPHA
jgi:hypothetical protein